MTSARSAQRRRWVWTVGRVAGIPVHIHFTLLLLLLWVVWIAAQTGGPILTRALFVIGLFASVLFHEVGHALAAKRFGIRTTEIVLYPFGGIARLKGMGLPSQEMWISLAGPAVNVAISGLLFVGSRFLGTWVPIDRLPQQPAFALQWLMMANLFLAGFNLIPAFPLDGGRVARALLASRLGMVRATAIAATIGQGLAIVMGLVAILMGHFILMFIAFFVFISASQEVRVQRSLAIMRGQKVGDAMVTRFDTLSDHETLGRAADLLLATYQQDFPVVSGREVVGVLTRPDLFRGLTQHGSDERVVAATARDYVRLSPGDSLRGALEEMQAAKQPVALVFEGDRLLGMLTEESVKEFLQLHASDLKSD